MSHTVDTIAFHRDADPLSDRRPGLRDFPLGIALPRSLRRGHGIAVAREDGPRTRARRDGRPVDPKGGRSSAAFVLTAWGILLARYAAVDELMIWVTPTAAAAVAGPQGMAGRRTEGEVLPMPLKYVPTRTAEDAVEEVVRVARSNTAELVPLDRAVEAAPGSTGFPTVGLALAQDALPSVDMLLTISEDGAQISIDYRTDTFDGPAVSCLLDALAVVLGQLFSTPDAEVADLDIVPPTDRALILQHWSGSAASRAEFVAVHERVARVAAQAPGSTAVVSAQESVSYRELEERANQLAHHLTSSGVGRGDLVALCLSRSVSMVVGMLATLKAGAAYLPFDPEYPLARLAFLLDDATPAVVLTESFLRERLPATGVPCIELDTDRELIAAHPVTAPNLATASGDRVYVIYTSGSTGRPKGVEIAFSGLDNLIAWHRATYQLDAGDRCSHLAGPAFDASVWEIWPTLAVGATLHVAELAAIGSPAALVHWLAEHRITVGFLPTPLAELVMAEPWPAESPLRYLLTGGDLLHRRPPDDLPFTLVNHYGPTENTVVSTAAVVLPPSTDADRDADRSNGNFGDRPEPPIGRPIAGTRVYVLDDRRHLVPAGVPGELYVGGAGLALGYLNRPELTAERFVSDPFSTDPQARLYRTGDLASWRPDGSLDFLGRIDDQVKVRGLRIELGEIEAVLTAQPGIVEAAVLVREDTPGHQRLIGYLVPHVRGDLDAVRLREALALILPGYMVPSGFVEMSALPLTHNGKVDRRALPVPDPTGDLGLNRYKPPRPGTESEVAALWSDQLGIAQVGALDDFFDLGGNSLTATRIAARLANAFGIAVPLSAVLAEPTVRALSAQIDLLRQRPSVESAGPIVPTRRGGPFPLTVAQSQFWLLDQLDGGSTYNIPLTIEITGPLQIEALRGALAAVVARHEPLHTTFPLVNGQPVQRIADPPTEIPLLVVDATEIEDVEDWVTKQSRLPLDVTTGPLLRTLLLSRGPTANVLLVVVHHLVFDGWSLGVFCSDLAAHYRALVYGDRPALAPLVVQSADLAVWQRANLTAQSQAADREYWSVALAGAPAVLDLPTDLARPVQPTNAGGRRSCLLNADTSDRVKAFARRQGSTPFMFLLAAFNLLLSRYTGCDDIVVGSPVAGRIRTELEPMVGCFINTLPLRTDLSGDPDFRELVARVRMTTVAAHQHQNLSLAQIVDEVGADRSRLRSPLFQVVFAFEDAHQAEFDFAGLHASVKEVDFRSTRSDLGLSITPVGRQLRVCAEYRSELFEPESVDRMLCHFATLVEAALADPAAPIGSLEILSSDERRRQIHEWNDTAADFADGVALHELVQCQVDRTPDAVAVIFEDDEELTYRELDERSNRLAHHLRRLGVRPESRVGICLQRSAEMVVAVLSVLKAGGGYVPLDPTNPAERLDFITADAGLHVVLTESALRGSSSWAETTVVELDTTGAEIAAMPSSRPENVNGSHDLAYAIYTSGSTGRPKGVLIEHRAVCNFIASVHKLFEMGSHDRVLQFASLGFDVSVFEIFSALACGARLCMARQDTLLSVKDLTRFMQRRCISVMDMPPSVMALLPGNAFPSLRIAFVGGEAFSGGLVNKWAAPGRRFFNGYGPTEGTVTVIVEECTARPGDSSPPIGRPMRNMRAYVLDDRDRLVPVGVPGQLHIGGVGLARGYIDRLELTAEKFIADPFVAELDARLYRTGDQVRQLRDGRLEYVGRSDDQVELRGFRIELGEVESALRTHPNVLEAVALLREDVPGQSRLIGYFTRRTDSDGVPELREYLGQRLPPYMVPATFVQLTDFPLNSSGKIDRRALPTPAQAQRVVAADSPAAPRNRREQALAELWVRLLGLPQVGIHDNFFAVGGHSLLGVQLVWEVAQAFGVDISIGDVFASPTIAGLAEVIEDAMLALLATDLTIQPPRTGKDEL